ncbi:MAG: hypothetical protein HYV18_05040 [Gammaproteobacteria bacterium]|nr:hypothetical protein [Gammaproteobacteria bacterium]
MSARASLPAERERPPDPTAGRAPRGMLALCAVVALAVFAFDLLSPRGVADGMVYVALVLLGLWLPWLWAPWALALVATLLTVAGYAWSEPFAEEWIVVTNRALSLGVVWATGILCYLQKRTQQALRDDILRRQAAERMIQELQAELYHVARRSELGGMVSAIAHELNQPLAAVRNYIAAAHRVVHRGPGAVPSDVDEMMTKAMAQAQSASEIIQQLLRLMCAGETDRAVERLNPTVEEATSLALTGSRDMGIAVTLDLAPDLPSCLMNRTQIQQVMLILVRNSLDAFDGCERRELVVRTGRNGDEHLEVAVADTGHGLAPKVREKLFMPFVTTKPDGVGIGLSVAHSIVEAHGGRLCADANDGGGTVFRFTLPAVAAPERQG